MLIENKFSAITEKTEQNKKGMESLEKTDVFNNL